MAETNFQKIVRILLKPFNTLEQASQQMATMRFVNNATGMTLTLLGKLVGQARNGIDDDELFRRYVRARIAANSSSGTGEEMYTITELVVTETGVELFLDNQGNAGFVMRLQSTAIEWDVVDILLTLLRKAVNGGVRVLVHWHLSSPATGFRFAKVDGTAPATGLGFRTFDGTDGGRLASQLAND